MSSSKRWLLREPGRLRSILSHDWSFCRAPKQKTQNKKLKTKNLHYKIVLDFHHTVAFEEADGERNCEKVAAPIAALKVENSKIGQFF